MLIFLEPKTCENLSCLQSTATCVNIRHPDIISFADSECSFRMMELHLLQYMRLSLRVCKFDLNIASCEKKIFTPSGVKVEPVQFILGVNCQRKAQHWLLETWMLRIITLRHSYNLGVENIIDYVSEGIQSKKGFQFSLLESGLGGCRAETLGLGRLEWLALKLMVPVQHVVEHNKSQAMQNFWKSLEFTLNSERWDKELDYLWRDRDLVHWHDTVAICEVWPRIEAHAVTECFTIRTVENSINVGPVHIFPDMRRIWRDRVVAGDLPSQVMRVLARALNDPGKITITEPIPDEDLDLEDQARNENLGEDCQSDSSIGSCVSDRHNMPESILYAPDLVEDISTQSNAKTLFSLNKIWWTGLIDEASKTSRL